jgi:hypothetical protein
MSDFMGIIQIIRVDKLLNGISVQKELVKRKGIKEDTTKLIVSGVKKIRTKGEGKVINVKSKRRHRKAIIF